MTTRRQRIGRLGLVAALIGGLAASAAPSNAAEVPPYPGALPDTPSATTVTGRGEFSDLSIHVNQTSDLTTQAVSVTWNWPNRSTLTGTSSAGIAYDANVLRIMQCWGDPITADSSDPATHANYIAADPGPAREHCIYGGSPTKFTTNVTAGNQQNRTANQYVAGTPTTYGQETVYQPTPATATSPSYPADIPFIAANGTVEAHQTTPSSSNPNSVKVYSNEFYDSFSTNELPANYTFGPDGRGGVQFQAQNSLDSRGTGCGALEKDSTTTYNKCWLVIVPQGTTDYDGSPLEIRPNSGIYKASAYGSPLASTNWKNRIVVPLNFLPSTSACAGGDGATYETLGSPLVNNAMLSWQFKLCNTNNTVYNYAIGTDERSREALASGSTSMQFTSQPVPPGTGSTPVTYAPVTLSGLGIAFVWDKAVLNSSSFVTTPGLPLPTIKLNQRLVAKLLTYSYQAANPFRTSSNSADNVPAVTSYSWAKTNPAWLGSDPEFLALNPDLANLGANNVLAQAKPTIATLQGPLNGSDAIAELWKWVMANQDARDFMAGKPAPGGMVVDPYYSTDATKNPNGAAFSTDTDSLPYADPWTGKPGSSTQLCPEQNSLAMTDIWPAARDFTTVAKDILTVNPLEKYTGSFTCNNAVFPGNPPGWKTSRTGVVTPGTRQLAGLTDTASGAQYGVTYASIPNASGAYVEPTTDGITAAANHLADTGVKGVQQPDITTTDPAAYPLSLIAYAGVTTNGTPKDACAAYAELLNYAAGDGQTSGTQIGDLPPGYVPLSATLRQETSDAAKTVAQCAQTTAPSGGDTGGGGSSGTGDSGSTGGDNTGDTGGSGTTAPADNTPVGTSNSPTTTTTTPRSTSNPVSLAATSRTKPDPSAFAYVVPIALGIGVLALLAAPVPGLRRRRPGAPDGPGGTA